MAEQRRLDGPDLGDDLVILPECGGVGSIGENGSNDAPISWRKRISRCQLGNILSRGARMGEVMAAAGDRFEKDPDAPARKAS